MAVQFENMNGITRGATYNFPVNAVVESAEKNCRYSEEAVTSPEFQELLISLRQFGQRVPGEVRKDGGRPVIVSGHRRLRGLKIINEEREGEGLEPFPFVAVYSSLNAEDAFNATVQENRGRKNLGVMDLAKTCGVFANLYKKTPGEIASKIGKSESTVNKYLSVLTLSKKLQDRIDKDRVSADVAFKIAELPESEREEAIKNIEEAGGKLTGPAVVKEARGKGLLAAKKQRKMGEVKDFLVSLTEGPANSVYTKRLARAFLEYIADEKDDDGMTAAFDRNCKEK